VGAGGRNTVTHEKRRPRYDFAGRNTVMHETMGAGGVVGKCGGAERDGVFAAPTTLNHPLDAFDYILPTI